MMVYIVDRNNEITINQNATYEPKPLPYPSHDLSSVFTHWDNTLKRNISTPNELVNKIK